MYCRNCGKEIKSDAAFCPYCGTAQVMGDVASAGADTGQTTYSGQRNYSGQGNYGNRKNYAGQTNMNTTYSNTLDDKEVVIEQARLHWVVLMPYLPLAVLIMIVLTALEADLIVLGIIGAVALMADPIVKYATTTLKFTNKRLIGKQGFLKSQNLDAPLNKINNVYVNSDLWGKMLGYGVLVISTSSGEYKYKCIQKPEDFQNALMQQIDQFENDQIRKQAMQMAAAMNSAMNGYNNI